MITTVLLLGLWSTTTLTTTTYAFPMPTPPASQSFLKVIQEKNRQLQERFKNKTTTTLTTTSTPATAKKKKKVRWYRDDEDDNDDAEQDLYNDDLDAASSSSSWLSWMVGGARPPRRETDMIKMREAEALGGLPRTDRYSSKDWLHNTITLPNSRILRDIRGPVMAMTSWATFLSLLYRGLLIRGYEQAAQSMCIPSAPHSLMVSSLSLLLVFKTNSAYQRFAEGRKIWEKISNASRDLYRMMNLYENEIGRSKRRRLQRLLAAFPYLLRHRIRPQIVMYRLDDEEHVREPEHSIVLYPDKPANDLDPDLAAVVTQEDLAQPHRRSPRPLYWVDKRTLPWRLLPPNSLQACAKAQNRPLWVCDRMAQELRQVQDGPNFSARERLALIGKVDKLSACIGACERIHQTAVPLNYARHSLRALTLWLMTLPFCLVQSLRFATGPVVFLVSWLLFGVYEIGYSIEDPFQGTLRLSVLCEIIRRDVLGDELIRNTAFEVENEDEPSAKTTAQFATALEEETEQDLHHEEEEVNVSNTGEGDANNMFDKNGIAPADFKFQEDVRSTTTGETKTSEQVIAVPSSPFDMNRNEITTSKKP